MPSAWHFVQDLTFMVGSGDGDGTGDDDDDDVDDGDDDVDDDLVDDDVVGDDDPVEYTGRCSAHANSPRMSTLTSCQKHRCAACSPQTFGSRSLTSLSAPVR